MCVRCRVCEVDEMYGMGDEVGEMDGKGWARCRVMMRVRWR
jgi:hypothetical protein